MALIVITQPTEEPVTLDEVKQHCRVDLDDDNLLLQTLITTARKQAEFRTGRALCEQTLELTQDQFACEIQLPAAPIISLTSVKYIDTAGTQQTLPAEEVMLDKDSAPGRLSPAYGKYWPFVRCEYNAVRIRYQAGYGTAADVPAPIKNWILLTVGSLYENRQAITTGALAEIPRALWDALLDPYIVWIL